VAWEILNGPISLDELQSAKERMRRGRAGGIDGIPIVVFLGSWEVDPSGARDDKGRRVRVGDRW
jgi:hypothetical protein